MLLIIELLFFGAGLWAVISGKLPTALFSILFGKGKYELSPDKTRLFALFLLSPLPLTYLVSFLLTELLGTKGTGYAILFEIVYVLSTIFASVIVARKIRQPEIQTTDKQPDLTASEHKNSSYGAKLGIIFGIVVFICITATTGFSLIGLIISALTGGTRLVGNFWADIFPFILLAVITGIGAFGIYRLVKAIRR
jgi:hypothetical protein